jgi:hypothetical protein
VEDGLAPDDLLDRRRPAADLSRRVLRERAAARSCRPSDLPAGGRPDQLTRDRPVGLPQRGEIPAEYPKGDLTGLPAEPDDSAPLPDRIAWEALEAVTNFANTVDPGANASCPGFDPATDKSVTCTVRFLGDAYDYVLSGITFTSSGLRGRGVEYGNVEYHAELTAGPIVRDFAEAVLRHQDNTEYTVCDMGDHVRLEFTDDHKRPSGSASITGESILVTGIECRALDAGTGHVSTVALELYEWGSPIHPSSRVAGG